MRERPGGDNGVRTVLDVCRLKNRLSRTERVSLKVRGRHGHRRGDRLLLASVQVRYVFHLLHLVGRFTYDGVCDRCCACVFFLKIFVFIT